MRIGPTRKLDNQWQQVTAKAKDALQNAMYTGYTSYGDEQMLNQMQELYDDWANLSARELQTITDKDKTPLGLTRRFVFCKKKL